MQKILLELWWIETRRTFNWKKMGIFIYILFIMASFLISFYVGGGSSVMEQMGDLPFERVATMIGLAIVLPDFLLKLMMKQDAAIMDDYLKAKPVTERTWNKFLILSNLLDYWNYMVPLVMALIYFIFMPVGYALLATLMTYMLSVADGLAITCLHKADDWARKLAVWVGLLFYLFILTLYAFCFIGLGAVAHILGMMALSGLAIYVLYRYLCAMRVYNDHQEQASSVRSMGRVSLLSLEYLCLIRAKRLRQSLIFSLVIIVPQIYSLSSTLGGDSGIGHGFMVFFMYFSVAFPSIILGQWVFGVEANFFHGLMTKPVSVYRLLLNKYYFYMLINLVAFLLLVPGLLMGKWSLGFLCGAALLAIGTNLLLLPTCLFSTRLDVFSSAFFNYQGANMSINVYSFVPLVPMIGFAFAFAWLPPVVAEWITSLVGIGLIAAHRPIIKRVADMFMARRYERMEKLGE